MISMDVLASALLIIGAYLLGALPATYYVAKLVKGVDLRRYGSGNVGISNFAVHAGKKWIPPLILFDILIKGMLPVALASHRVLDLGVEIEVAAGFAAIVGHNWPVWLKFNGGRGMAMVLGVLAALNYQLVLMYGVVAAVGWLATRRKDSAMWWGLAALLLPVWSLLLNMRIEVTIFCVAFVFMTAIKRVTSNRSTLRVRGERPMSTSRLIWNRLVFDRDTSSRAEWIYRGAENPERTLNH